MSSIFYNIVISPIELIVEIVFELLFRIVGNRQFHQGIVLVGVSLTVSLLTLPLYRMADAIQRDGRAEQKRLSGWISHIRRSFRGDERFMMLQMYYKISGYSPIHALKSAVPLLLQIPFFTAAYHFLSHLKALQGSSFGAISDLGAPDALISLGSISLNLLPILMTAINCVSSAIYLRGFSARDKIQTYSLALIFLVLLYNSPSGLVLYWTCNNIFSLVKNVFYKLKNPRKILAILTAIFGISFTAAMIFAHKITSESRLFIVIAIQIITVAPVLRLALKKTKAESKIASIKSRIAEKNSAKPELSAFLSASVFLVLLTGILIPSAVIASSPAEFCDIQNYKNPLYFLSHSFCYALGFFAVWAGIVRYMLPKSARRVLDAFLWTISGIFLLNYLLFGKNLGILTPFLMYEKQPIFSASQKLFNLGAVFALAIALPVVHRFRKIVLSVSFV